MAGYSWTEDKGNHPNLFDRVVHGKEVTDIDVPAGHQYKYSNELIHGDGFFNEGQSWVAKSIRSHDKGVTVVAEPRKGFVGRTVMSQLQFGTPGITTEDTDERAFTFPHGRVLPVRM